MSSYMAKPTDVERKWYVVDAADRPLGRTAVIVATLLRGKHKPTYTPHVDCGDFVIVTNADKAILTGKKLEQKYHRTHSGWPGGLKETQYKTIMNTRPELAMRLAVKGMLGKNSLGRAQIVRMKLFSGSEHTHAAQKPEVWEDKQ
ncbi:MAG: 50S ribosomal protein L13 [Oscillospiraceae bacterium]|jgi:large subunit ribosomal protein L13|nr:50S ribosomal protein L13 [Oscillospiraceae bacterium]